MTRVVFRWICHGRMTRVVFRWGRPHKNAKKNRRGCVARSQSATGSHHTVLSPLSTKLVAPLTKRAEAGRAAGSQASLCEAQWDNLLLQCDHASRGKSMHMRIL